MYTLDVAARRADLMWLSERFDHIDDRPLHLYFWCELYRDENGPQRWLISDPSGFGPVSLREPFLIWRRACRTDAPHAAFAADI